MKGLKEHTGLDMIQLDLPGDQVVRSPVAKSPVAKQFWELPTLVAKQPSTHSKQHSPSAQSMSSSSREMSPIMSSSSSTEEVAYSRLSFNKAKRQDDIPEPPVLSTQESYATLSRPKSTNGECCV